MNERDAADAMERALLGEQERVLTDTQRLVMDLANDDLEAAKRQADELRRQAEVVDARGRDVMRQAVLAIRKDHEVPNGVQVLFAQGENDTVVMRWMNPPPPPATLALVRDDQEPAAADTGSGAIE